MQVVLIGDKKIHKLILPQIPSGNYLLDAELDNGNRKIKIDAQDGKWKIASDDEMSIINSENISIIDDKIKIKKSEKQFINQVFLEFFSVYTIRFSDSKKLYLLYCLPVYEDNYVFLKTKKTIGISIGSDSKNQIRFDEKFVSKMHAKLSLNNGVWIIENLDKKYGIYVNNKRVLNETKFLYSGDIIFIMGLKIIVVGNNLFINNPNNKMEYDEKSFELIEKNNNIDLIEDEDDGEIYSPTDYFYRSPRMVYKSDVDTITIEAPPIKEDRGQVPQYLAIASSVSMGAMSFVSIFSMISSMRNGSNTTFDIIVSISFIVVMLVAMILIPILTYKWNKKRKAQYEFLRQKKYKKYIENKKVEIDELKNNKRNYLYENFSTAEECSEIIQNKEKRLWERTLEDEYFLKINLGIGNIPLDVNIKYPERKDLDIELDEDNLEELVYDFTKEIDTIKDVPIITSLKENNIIAIVDKDGKYINRYMQNIFVQLMAFHSYSDLKLVFLVDKDEENKWDYVKLFPYVWNNSKDFRFFEDDYGGMEVVSKYLEDEFKKRQESNENETYNPYYLIITDNYRKIDGLKIISDIQESEKNLGFSLLCISNNLHELPSKCQAFITLEEKKGNIFKREGNKNDQKEFSYNIENKFFFDKIIKTISNIPIKVQLEEKNALPDYYTFLEMYNVGLIEQLNILDRWNNNDSTISLAAPIGVKPSGKLLSLDVHEKFHGPHGLIAGSTGSGKSEFIITYILSLAINYHPDDVAFVLIDYKGGGLAGAFQKQDIKLPHLVGTITNIDKEGIQRSLVSIKSELTRRQIWFNEARDMTDEGTIDIYKYQKLYHTGVVKKPIPHLLIICDEFAELKQQQPDFMDELVSVSRIGRSLGVHLILATQKPSGVVDEQMRSNSKFAICLKVQDEGDSTEVIERPDAAYIKQSGRFYLKVGKNDLFEIGQSGWSGAPYFPADISKKRVDDSIKFISNTGSPIKEVTDYSKKSSNQQGEQLTNIVKYMNDLAKKEGIKTEQLWLDDIPEKIYIKDTKEKYKFRKKDNDITLCIGEYDDPSNQKQGLVSLSLNKDGGIAVYGTPDSGKETLMSTMIYDLMSTYSSDELWMYILDFGTESLKIYKDAPHVGDIMFMNMTEKINRFFTRIKEIMKERKQILSDYNGDYNFYIQSRGQKMPFITVFINGFDNIPESMFETYDDLLQTITREGVKMGIAFIISMTSSGDMRYRMSQNFKNKVALTLNDPYDYSNIFDKLKKQAPARRFGRGFVNLGEEVFEFQTAKPCEPKDYNVFIKSEIEKANINNTTKAKDIPVLPDVLKLETLKNKIKGLDKLPIGLRKKDLGIETFDFKENYVNIITADEKEVAFQFGMNLIEEMKLINDLNIIILDSERKILTGKKDLSENYQKLLDIMKEKPAKIKETVCFIFGLEKLLNFIENYKEPVEEKKTKGKKQHDDEEDEEDDEEDEDEIDGTEKLTEIINSLEESEKFTFVVLGDSSEIRDHGDDEWYDKNEIWVGEGFEDQYILDVNATRKELSGSSGCSFGFLNKNNKTIVIKLLEMKEKSEDDEDE